MHSFSIELKSDLCVSNGENYGSIIDTDVCYDECGFPVIKGKTIKGCILEIAEELADNGVLDDQFIKDVFGTPGSRYNGLLIINDAVLKNYENEKKAVHKHMLSLDKVIECFSYTRGQTSIDENGTAKKKSLRNIRVVNRGVEFVCEYELDDRYTERFEKCIKLLRHIGMNRTRGLGEVKCTPSVYKKDEFILDDTDFSSGILKYTFTTLSPLISGKENEKINYIPGSTMEGLCFRKLGNEKMNKMLSDGMIFSDAVLSDGQRRYFPAPAFLAKQKEADYGDNGMPVFVFDTDKCENAEPPAMPVKTLSVSVNSDFSELYSSSLNYEINYHHKQSDNNPGMIEGKNFYQISSICAGQKFSGFIFGKPDMLKTVYEKFGMKSTVHIGYYKSSGYGRCQLDIEEGTNVSYEKTSDRIAVCLAAPVIMYDDNGMPSVLKEVFGKYFSALLSDNRIKDIEYAYLRYTTAGGYNSTWNLNKQRFQMLDAGSAFILNLEKEVCISSITGKFVGERTAEGFGEISVYDYNDILNADKNGIRIKRYKNILSGAESCDLSKNENESFVIKKILEKEKFEKISMKALKNAERVKSCNIGASLIGRLLLMCCEQESYAEFEKAVKSIKNNDKKELALNFIKIDDEDIKENDEYYKIYMKTMLTQAKYILRKEK